VDASAERVELKAAGSVPSSIISALGKDNLNVSQMAVSELTKDDVICVLALDPNGQRAFEVLDGADFKASTCSVQVNSSDDNAAYVGSGSTAFAKSFCTSGGASGSFSPFVNTECSVIEDPYANLQAPPSAPCINDKAVRLKGTGNNATKDGTMLLPGTYCGGLTVSGLNISFTPGEYIILDGPLVFARNSLRMARWRG